MAGGAWRWIGQTLPNGITPVVIDEAVPGRPTEYFPVARSVSHRWELPPVATLAAAKDLAIDLAFECDPASVYQSVKA